MIYSPKTEKTYHEIQETSKFRVYKQRLVLSACAHTRIEYMYCGGAI